MSESHRLGAEVVGEGCRFALFTSTAARCSVRLFDAGGAVAAEHELSAEGDGYFAAWVEGVRPGARYKFVLDERELPDPYARALPDGVHGPALVVDHHFRFEHQRPAPRPLPEHVIYELHVGTFTAEGTYDAAAEKLEYLSQLGATMIELMPLSSFSGRHGWGYDGVAHFAPHAPYGSPDSLRRFVDRAHRLGLFVILDVVYNHFGPSGNYLGAYSPHYFTSEYHNAWGDALNFREPVMRRYVIDNARYWLEEFRFDGFRLDATHAIFDPSPVHVIAELASEVRAVLPEAVLFAEDERNEPACVTELGCDAIWADDFHHQVRVTLTRERDGYFAGYAPGAQGIAETIAHGWLYEGQIYPPSGKPRGKPASRLPLEAFVYCIQNHDQVGNRALGTRLCHELDVQAYGLASVLLLFLPMTPLLFQGQEWGSSSPFLYFTDHDAELGAAVTAGRRREFARFEAFSDEASRDAIPDPQASATFERSKLAWAEQPQAPHAGLLALYRELIALRRSDRVLGSAQARSGLSTQARGELLAVRRLAADGSESRVLLANFGTEAVPRAGAPYLTEDAQTLFSFRGAGNVLPPHSALMLACRERPA